MEANQIFAQPLQNITAAAFSAKYRSKREIFNLLSVDCIAYLPSYDAVTI